MNLRTALPAALLLLFCAAAASAQLDNLGPPPVKMGLWQNTVTSQISGLPNMPAGMPPTKPVVTQSCMTSADWQKGMTQMQQNLQRQKMECSNVKLQHNGNQFIFDEQCAANGYNSTFHIEWTIDDQENMHGISNAQIGGAGVPAGMTMHGTMTSKYLSSDCGSVKPGESKTVQQ
jgi:hypothetical protein